MPASPSFLSVPTVENANDRTAVIIPPALVAHDLNNVLSASIGFLELSMMETPPASPSIEYLVEIGRALETMRRIVRALGSLGTHRIDDLPTTDAAGIWEAIFKSRLAHELAHWTVTMDRQPVPPVRGLDDHIGRLAHNLIDHFVGSNRFGLITRLDIRIVEGRSPEGRSYSCLQVDDNGPVPAADALSNLWAPYGLKGLRGRMSALELSAVRHLAGVMGGMALTEPLESGGLRWIIALPAAEENR